MKYNIQKYKMMYNFRESYDIFLKLIIYTNISSSMWYMNYLKFLLIYLVGSNLFAGMYVKTNAALALVQHNVPLFLLNFLHVHYSLTNELLIFLLIFLL